MLVRDERGIVRGEIKGETFYVIKWRAKHYLRKYRGWGINVHVWNQIKDVAKRIEIYEPDTESIYKVTIDELKKKNLQEIFFVEDKQLVLEETWFEKEEKDSGQLRLEL